MKRYFISLLTSIMAVFAVSCQYDDSALIDRLDDLEGRVQILEQLCNQMNTNISSLQQIVNALQNKDYIKTVTPIAEGDKTIGYTITFEKGEPITLYNGKDGKDGADGADGEDGYTPVIGVSIDEDGIYYWTLDGKWLTDEDGNKISASAKDGADGKDGVMPELQIKEGYWYVSYDGGENWERLGRATGASGSNGDSFFKGVNTGAGYVELILSDGTSILIPTDSSSAVVYTSADMAAALTADQENINVVLAGNIDLPISSLGTITGGSGEYKLGGENTKKIVIDLNNKKLNITTTYWSNLGAKNDDALFTIKNGTMTSSQATGTWNSYDLTFSNCDYEIENVTFDKSIAFDNAGKSVSLKDVTINETHDYYAMWITAAGQSVTIDGMTINSLGRGIKIDEQYVGTPAKVTLNISNVTFKTAKKGAIMVKSAAGAEINASELDISGVAADNVNAVWVDEDSAQYADKVVVNGASKVVEQ